MFSSTVTDTAAAGYSNPTRYHLHQYHPQVSSYDSDVLSDRNNTNLVPRMVAQDANDHQLPAESTITLISPLGNNTSMEMPGSIPGASKKKSDNRSKVRTAQGLRDRRVRLSIGIARKFFDLQDLLGFDKPSKTVEWLLTKSNKAILELPAASSISSEAAGTEDGFKSLSSSRGTATHSTNQIQQVSSDNSLKTMKKKGGLLARESREKARARARARTIAKLHHQKISLPKIPGVKNGDQQTSSFIQNCSNFNSPSLLKASCAERQEEKRKDEEQLKQKQSLQLHCYGPNPDLSLDWDIGSVVPRLSSSESHRLNLSRDVEIYTRLDWDHLLNNYRNS